MNISIALTKADEFSADVLRLRDTGERWIVCRIGGLSISFNGYDAEACAEARALAATLDEAADRLDAAVAQDQQLALPDVTTTGRAVV